MTDPLMAMEIEFLGLAFVFARSCTVGGARKRKPRPSRYPRAPLSLLSLTDCRLRAVGYWFLFFNSRSLRSSGRAVAATQASAAFGSTSSHWRAMFSMLELR
jgi:hypothetical protein